MSVNNEENTLAQTEVKNESVLASLGINGQLFAFQLLNFAIVAGIVWFLILKPLVKKMEERKKQVDESIDNVKAIETSLQMSQKKYQEKIDEAKVAANKIIEKAYNESEVIAKQLKEKAHKEIEILVTQVKKNIEIDKQEMKDELRKETAEMVVMVVEKLLEKKFSGKEDEKFVLDILKSLNK